MKFRYLAKSLGGETSRGTVEAVSQSAVVSLLREQKLVPVKIEQIQQSGSMPSMGKLFGHVSLSDLTNFTRQLATMMTAGLPLTDALSLLKAQSSPALSKVVGGVLADVQSGVSLSAAMSKHPKVFSAVYTSLIRAGEAAGIMENILNRLADNTEKAREFRSKVVGAMIYPIIILVGMIGVVILMMVVVIPKLTDLYKDFGADLPFATKLLVATSDLMVNNLPAMVLVSAGVFFGVRWFLNTESGKRKWHSVAYKIPVFGTLSHQVMIAELTRTLSLLVGAGVSVVEGLNIVSDSIDNVVAKAEVRKCAKQVEKGFPLSISFTESPVFPPILGQMVAVGEETGKMDEVLSKVSHYFESESEERVKGLTTAIEPIILIVMAVGIGFLMYAIVMPIYSITNNI